MIGYGRNCCVFTNLKCSDEEEEEEEDTKPKILELLTRLRGSLKLVEILKCIVYGGLIESITSLSVVASGAATDASTCMFLHSFKYITVHHISKLIIS